MRRLGACSGLSDEPCGPIAPPRSASWAPRPSYMVWESFGSVSALLGLACGCRRPATSLSGALINEMINAPVTSGKNELACSREATEHLREPRASLAARTATWLLVSGRFPPSSTSA